MNYLNARGTLKYLLRSKLFYLALLCIGGIVAMAFLMADCELSLRILPRKERA